MGRISSVLTGVPIQRGFSKRLEKKNKERTWSIAQSDDKMIKLTTKQDTKEAEAAKVH
jgi:hypothetical protein